MKKIAATLFLGGLALSPELAAAQGGSTSLEQLAVEMAQTPEQHAALARYYRTEAAEARAKAKRHEGVGRSYMEKGRGAKPIQQERMRRHCQDISDKYNGMADDYDALAKLHDEEAKKTE